MSSVEDKDLGWSAIEKQLIVLASSEIVTGIQASEDDELLRYATINEFGSDEWIISSKQAFYMAKVLMGIDPETEKARFWGTFRALRGKKMRIPERSYLRASFDANQDLYREGLERLFDGVVAGMDAKNLMDQLGATAEGIAKNWIDALQDPPNAGLTVARKGANNPLVGNGRMKNAVRSIVRNRSKG